MLMQTVRLELFSETAFGCTISQFVKSYNVPVGFITPSSFEAVHCFVCGRRMVAVVRYRMTELASIRA